MVLMVLSLFHRCSFHSLPFDVRPLIQTHKTCSSLFRSVHFYCLHLCACACVCRLLSGITTLNISHKFSIHFSFPFLFSFLFLFDARISNRTSLCCYAFQNGLDRVKNSDSIISIHIHVVRFTVKLTKGPE